MEGHATSESLSLQSRVNFLFALAKAYEDRERLRPRLGFLPARQRRCSAPTVHYDPVQTEVMNDRLVEVYSAELLDSLRGHGDPDAAPIFILGLPRSGSTLLEQILASHPQVEGTAELPYIGRLATSLNRNRGGGVNYPEAMRELEGRNLAALGADTSRSRGCTDARASRASSTRCRTISRTSASSH